MTKPHTLLTTKNLVKSLELLQEISSWPKIARCLGASESTCLRWVAKSAKDKKQNNLASPFWMQFENEFTWYHDAVNRARARHLYLTESKIRSEAKDGVEELCYNNMGEPIWKERLETIGRSDDYIRRVEGLADFEDVDRLERDEAGKPLQLSKRTMLAAPLRKAVLAASHSDYREIISHDVTGTVVHISKPLERLRSDGPRPALEELRQLALLSPAARRERLHAVGTPVNARGAVIPVNRGAPSGDNRADDGPEAAKPGNPRAYQAPTPTPPTPPAAPRPAYAKPIAARLEDREGLGAGPDPSLGGGYKVS